MQSSHQWDVMAATFFKVHEPMWPHKWKTMWLLLWLACIVLLIELTWLCCFYQSSIWLFVQRPYFRHCMVVFFHSPKNFLEFHKLSNLFTIRKQTIEKCEKKMDQHVVFGEMCDGTIPSFDLQRCMMHHVAMLPMKFEPPLWFGVNFGFVCHYASFGLCA